MRECKADFAVIGEGELTILELMNNWGDMRSIRDIKGIVYRENERFFINPKREPIKNLDELPFPAWDLMNPLNYKSMPFGRLMKRYPAAPILTSRGCPYRCSFCASTNFWGNKFRRRSPKNVVDEIEYLRDRFGIREIHIWDDNFVFSKKHVVGICYEIRKRKIDMTFTCSNGVHINHLSKELLSLMRKVGFYMLGFTIESGSKAVLKKSNKNLDLKKVSEMAKTAKSLGYYIPGYFIFGLPGENYQNARRTIQFAKKLPLDGMVCFTAKPIPGSKLFVDWSKERSNQNIDYNWFHFLVSKNVLTYTDGKRRINLPRDAMREYHFRPSAILNILKMIFSVSKKFQIKQSREIIRRFFQTYL